MTVNFIISDLVSRLNVASRKRLLTVKVIRTDFSIRILSLLYSNGVINSFQICRNYIFVYLKYYKMVSAFKFIKIISTPGNRVFWTVSKLSIKYYFGNFSGFFIISTSKGLLTSNDCLLGSRISGEIILQVAI